MTPLETLKHIQPLVEDWARDGSPAEQEARDLVREAIASGGWQDISSAPQSMRINDKILLCHIKSGRVETDIWPLRNKDKWTMLNGVFHAPTHWQPLPDAPPTTKEGDKLQAYSEYRAHGGTLDFTAWEEKVEAAS